MRTQIVDSRHWLGRRGVRYFGFLRKNLAHSWVCLLIAYVLFCTGCDGGNSVLLTDYSLAPYGTPVDAEPLLGGTWRLESESLEFVPTGVNQYEVRGSNDIAGATLFRVDDYLIIELTVPAPAESPIRTMFLACIAQLEGRELILRCPQQAARADDATQYASTAPDVLLDLIRTKGGDPSVFSELMRLHRPAVERLRQLEELAQAGDVNAQLEFGDALLSGDDVDRDVMRAVQWIDKAASSDTPAALYRMGELHEQGIGFDREADAAILWYRKAASHEFGPALYALGRMYEHGIGVDADITEAAEWYQRAAQQDDFNGHLHMAILQRTGEEVPRDEPAALAHLEHAVQLRPDSIEAWDELAQLRSTALEARVRNLKKAIFAASTAIRFSSNSCYYCWDHLAGAYAAQGRIAAAVSAEREAMDRAYGDLKDEYEARCREYESRL